MAKLELLSPAGDMEKLRMAVLYGADAVYLAADFNGWKKTHPLIRESEGGVWSVDIPRDCFDGSDLYKFIVVNG